MGLAPAFQRTLIFDRFRVDEVNRAREVVMSAGGKAVNAVLALTLLQRTCVVAGLNGGDTGRFISSHLAAHGVTCAFTRTPWATRTCTTLLDDESGDVTELVEEAKLPTPELLRRFEARGRALLRSAQAGVICGTLPAGVPEILWMRLASEAQIAGVPLVIDSHAAPLLRALRCNPLLAKMNVHELEKTFAVTCRTEVQIAATARRLITAGAAWALITRGPQAAILIDQMGEAWRISPPKVDAVSTVGSGDCVTAGLVHAWLNGTAMPDAVRFGMGCGSAKALTRTPAEFSRDTARKFTAECSVGRIRFAR